MGRALITGPTGCVGTAIIRELLRKGHEVTALVRPESPQLKNLPSRENLRIVFGDLTDLSAARKALSGSYDTFYHLGWTGTYGADRTDLSLQKQNVGFTLEAVELAKAAGCGIFLFAGSQSEFGPVDDVITPATPCKPDNPYGVCKLEAEEASREACRRAGIRFEACRIFSTYGPCDKPYTMVMSTLLKILGGERLSFTEGDQLWNYLYSDDAGRAFVAVAERGIDGKVYLVASDKSRPLRDYITEMRDLTAPGAELHFGEVPYYPNQIMRMRPDISELIEDTGFLPEVPFREGILKTLSWLKRE